MHGRNLAQYVYRSFRLVVSLGYLLYTSIQHFLFIYNSHLKQEINFHLLCKVLHLSPEHFSCITGITDAFLNKDKGTIHTCSRTHHTSYLQFQNSVVGLYLPPFWERRCITKLLLSGSSSLSSSFLSSGLRGPVSEVRLQLHSRENHQEPSITAMGDSSSFKKNKSYLLVVILKLM